MYTPLDLGVHLIAVLCAGPVSKNHEVVFFLLTVTHVSHKMLHYFVFVLVCVHIINFRSHFERYKFSESQTTFVTYKLVYPLCFKLNNNLLFLGFHNIPNLHFVDQ